MNLAFELVLKNYILKVQTASQVNEFKLYQWLQDKLPVPNPLFQINFDGLDYLCMEQVEGHTLQIPENQMYSNHTLFEKLMTLVPDTHELVFTHGDFCPENLLFKDHKLKAYIDINRGGVADKYQDIALAIRTITDDIDPSFVPLFCETYGIDQLDSQKLAFYTLLDEFF